MVNSIKTPLDQRHLHVNDNNRHDTFPWNNVSCVRGLTTARKCTRRRIISFNGRPEPFQAPIPHRQFANLVSRGGISGTLCWFS